MNIDPSQNGNHLEALRQHLQPSKAKGAENKPEGLSAGERQQIRDHLQDAFGVELQQSETAAKQRELVSQLMAEEQVRPEVVARGRELLESGDYPGPEQLNQLARTLLSPIE